MQSSKSLIKENEDHLAGLRVDVLRGVSVLRDYLDEIRERAELSHERALRMRDEGKFDTERWLLGRAGALDQVVMELSVILERNLYQE